MFSFLKKKQEPNYSLDDTELPSLSSSQNPSTTSSQSTDLPNDSLNSVGSGPAPANDSFAPSQEHPASADSLENSQLAQENPYKDQSTFPQTQYSSQTSFDSSSSSTSSSFSVPPEQDQSTPVNQNTDLSKIQLETIDKRVSLLDTRLSVMEDKIDKIYQMISMEVKPETKMKVEMKK